MKVKYTKLFNRRNRKNIRDLYPVEISCYLKEDPSSSKRYYHNTGVYISKKQWSKAHSEINHHHPNQDILNSEINKVIAELEMFEIKKNKAEGGYFKLAYFKEFKTIEKQSNNFIEFVKNHIDNDKTVSKATKVQYNSFLVTLKEFRDTETTLDDIDLPFVKSFDNFLYSKGYKTNTVWKYHKNLRKFINLAIDLDLYESERYPYKKFKAKKEQTERIFLTEDELKEFENIKIEDEQSLLSLVKLTFLFECYTGIRYSDIRKIKRSDIDVSKNEVILKLKAKKTGKFDRIPLHKLFNGKPVEILKFLWKEDDSPFFGGYALQTINKGLKELSEHHNINKNITTHVGRHTFGSTMSSKIPVPILQMLMQHSDSKTTAQYIHLTNQKVGDALDNVNW